MNNATNQPQSQTSKAEGFHPSTPAAHQKAYVESNAEAQARSQLESIMEMVEALTTDDEDEAREAIQDDPLSVLVRSGWHIPGEEAEPEEFEILLCTGGPAVRIIGALNDGQPTRPRLQYQDWGTPWTEYIIPAGDERDALETYCQQFYFGE